MSIQFLNNSLRIFAGVLFLTTTSLTALAQTYALPAQGDVVGRVQTAVVKTGETLPQVARNFDMGYTELTEANPSVDPDKLVPGTVLVIPSQYILPNTPREGLVVNLAEMRLFYYPKGGREVVTYPMGIGREGENTVIGVFKVIQHIPNPPWYAPESIRQSRAAQGVFIPKVTPPGPDNPLGKFAMRLSKPTYLIHGTNDPLGGIGRRSSSGCMRLYPEDIESLFKMVANGTNVYIINEPYKVGWNQNELYLESHIALQAEDDQALDDKAQIRNLVQLAVKDKDVQVDWKKALDISQEVQGIPQAIGRY
jgi:L,D-transpeptidase ErfK/SrfK